MTNYLNEEDEDDKYSSEEKISDDVPEIEVEIYSDDDEDWGTDDDDDDWGDEEVSTDGDEMPDEIQEPMDDAGDDGDEYPEEYGDDAGDGDKGENYGDEDDDEILDTMKEPSTAEINAEPSGDKPKGFRVLSFQDFVSNK